MILYVGASWIHNHDPIYNPISILAKTMELELYKSKEDGIIYTSNGRIKESEVNKTWEKAEELLETSVEEFHESVLNYHMETNQFRDTAKKKSTNKWTKCSNLGEIFESKYRSVKSLNPHVVQSMKTLLEFELGNEFVYMPLFCMYVCIIISTVLD